MGNVVTCDCGAVVFTETRHFCSCGAVHEPTGPRYHPPVELPVSRVPLPKVSDWSQLHAYPVDHWFSWDAVAAKAWYRHWEVHIPNLNCSCREHWREHTKANPPVFDSANEFLDWSIIAHNHVSANHAMKPTMPHDEARRYWLSKQTGFLQYFVTWDTLTQDAEKLASIILEHHPDVSGIAGVPRSGLRVAADVALRLGVPLYEASKQHGLRTIGSGLRLRTKEYPWVHGERRDFDGPIVLVDDSVCSGTAIRELQQDAEIAKLPFYVVYATPGGQAYVDGFVKDWPLPHWFDWNFFNNGNILRESNVGIDFDGVLCGDCSVEDDDDGERYVEWMRSVSPIRFPRDFKIPFIITARREAYRAETEAWLAKYRVNYGTLVMFPGTFDERSRTDIGAWKARESDKHGVGIFVESSYVQAKRIAELRQTITLSIEVPE